MIMGKKKRNRKSSLLPMLAIGVGVYLLARQNRNQSPPKGPVKLPTYNPTQPGVQRLWPRTIPQTI